MSAYHVENEEMTMIRRAFIQEGSNGRLGTEERDLIACLEARGITVELFTRKKLARRQLPLDRQTLVAGEVPVVIGALRQLGIDTPVPNDYPISLQALLHRRIWTSTVRRLMYDLYEGSGRPVFAKPSERLKRFTGHIFASPDDVIYLEGASRSTSIFCTDVVDWVSEYRCYVVRGEIVGIRHYAGNPAVGVDEAVVARAIRSLESAG
jgi:ATP-grasp domain, R2K clade family 2